MKRTVYSTRAAVWPDAWSRRGNSSCMGPLFRNFRQRSKIERDRSGYTLLELMVALALSLFLLGTINLALNLQVRYSVSGRSSSVRSQVLRSVIDRLTMDIRSTVPQQQSSGSERLANSASIQPDLYPEQSPLDTTSEPAPVSSLWGSSDFLVLRTNHRPRSFVNPLPATIVWRCGNADIGKLQNLPGFDFDQSTLLDVLGSDSNALMRIDLATAVGNGRRWRASTTDLARQPTIRVNEIRQLRFRFYDGRRWFNSWDSVSQSTLPRAVEVKIELTQPARSGGSVANERYSFATVIDLPTSHPQSMFL